MATRGGTVGDSTHNIYDKFPYLQYYNRFNTDDEEEYPGESFLNPFATSFGSEIYPLSTLTPQQSTYLNELMPFLSGQIQAGAQPSTTITPGTTQQYWESTVRDPALKNWQENTKGEILAGAGTLHSGATANTLAQSYGNLQNQLQAERGNLMYQDELSRRQLEESGANRYQNTIQQLLSALGITGVENIVDSPSDIEAILNAMPNIATGGLASLFGGGGSGLSSGNLSGAGVLGLLTGGEPTSTTLGGYLGGLF